MIYYELLGFVKVIKLKNLIVNIFKTLFFFDLGVIVMSLLPALKLKNPALLKLATEGMFFGFVLFISLIFVLAIEKRKIKIGVGKRKIKSFLIGAVSGIAIPVICVAVIALFKGFDLSGFNKTPHLYYWIPALLLNAITTELFLRGYLFSLYKKHYGFLFSTVVTTLLSLSLNTEIFKLNKIFIANIILLNLLLCFLREYTDSVVATVTARFFYSLLSCLLLGSLTLSGEYPTLLKATFKGKALLTGGEYGIEGSLIVLILSSALVLLFCFHKFKPISVIKRKLSAIKQFLKRISSKKKTAGTL